MTDDPGGLEADLADSSPFAFEAAFSCGADRVLAIFGPSGSGKTTLLRCVAGLHRPTHARIVCRGRIWADTTSNVHVPTHRRRVGVVTQEHALFPHLSARDNVMASLRDVAPANRRATAARWLAAMHLQGLEQRRPSELSGGQRQRVALARALAREPHVLLLDEPFAAVDRELRGHLHRELEQVRQQIRAPILLVTHDFDDVVRLATDVLLLDRGRVAAAGAIEALTSRTDLSWARYGVGAGSVFDGQVGPIDRARGLAEVAIGGNVLLVPHAGLSTGLRVRVRLPAREIILATRPPEGLSLHNVLPARVAGVGPPDGQMLVALDAGSARLLAEITKDAIERLRVAPGRELFALIKSVAVDIHGRRAEGEEEIAGQDGRPKSGRPG